MTIGADIYWWSTRIFLQKIGSQCCSPIRRKGRLVWWMFDHFRGRLRRMMTLDAGNRFGPIDTAILRDVLDVAELYTA